MRKLRTIAAAWNAASLANALVGILVVANEPRVLFTSHSPWLLPFSLVATKLLAAQATKLVAASTCSSLVGVHALLAGLTVRGGRGAPSRAPPSSRASLEAS